MKSQVPKLLKCYRHLVQGTPTEEISRFLRGTVEFLRPIMEADPVKFAEKLHDMEMKWMTIYNGGRGFRRSPSDLIVNKVEPDEDLSWMGGDDAQEVSEGAGRGDSEGPRQGVSLQG